MGSYNGSGVFVRSFSWQTDALNGIKIRADRMDTEDNGFATNGLTNCVTRDGQSPWTASIPAGGHKITGLAAGTNPNDSASLTNLQGDLASYSAVSGTDTYAAALTPALAALTDGQTFALRFTNANTITTPTLNVDSSGAKTITTITGGAIPIGAIAAGLDTFARYNASANKFALLALSSISNIAVQSFVANGTYTPMVGMKFALAFVTAGGGKGATGAGGAGAGAAGETSLGLFTAADIGASKAVTVGAGATSGSGSNSSLGALLTAVGGGGGGAGGGSGGSGGTGTGLHIPGGDGAPSPGATVAGGQGGASFWGGGGRGSVGGGGGAGEAYGSGGGGGDSIGGGHTGGDGKVGVVYIIEFG